MGSLTRLGVPPLSVYNGRYVDVLSTYFTHVPARAKLVDDVTLFY